MHRVCLDSVDLHEVTELFEQIRKYRTESYSHISSLQCTTCAAKHRKLTDKQVLREDQGLTAEFEGYVRTVMESLANQLDKNLTLTEKKIEVMKSKFFLTDVCFEKAVDALGHILTRPPEKQAVSLLNNLRNLICTSFVAMSQMQAAVAADLNQIKQEFEELLQEKENELKSSKALASELSLQKEEDLAKHEALIQEL